MNITKIIAEELSVRESQVEATINIQIIDIIIVCIFLLNIFIQLTPFKIRQCEA